MPQYFIPEQDLTVGEKSCAYWNISCPTTLVIFIHGFKGSSKSTWDDFPSLINDYLEFSKCDVVFYGYDGLHTAAEYSALKFKKFLNDMYETPFAFIDDDINKFGIRPDEFKYKKIVIVAHSLGAIVTRRALLNGKKDKANWIDITRMILFAPAHNGARDIEGLVSSVVTGPFKLLTTYGKYEFTVLDDLEEDSQTITKIIEETKELLQKGQEGEFTKAAAVVWAENDKIVRTNTFCADPEPIPVDNKNHISVCKPNSDEPYLKPVEILKEFLK